MSIDYLFKVCYNKRSYKELMIMDKNKLESMIIEKQIRERELEFSPDKFHFEMVNYKNAGVEVVDTLKKSKYVVLGGYVAPIFYGDTSFYGNATCLGNAFCGALLYDLNGNGKGFENVVFLNRHNFPFKPAMINDVLSYVGAEFELNGNEFDEYGYLNIKSIKFANLDAKNRKENVEKLLKEIDAENIYQKGILSDLEKNIKHYKKN